MITTAYLEKKGFIKESMYASIPRGVFRKPHSIFWGYKFKLGEIQITICCIDNDSPFEYSILGNKLGVLPNSKKFLQQLIKHYG